MRAFLSIPQHKASVYPHSQFFRWRELPNWLVRFFKKCRSFLTKSVFVWDKMLLTCLWFAVIYLSFYFSWRIAILHFIEMCKKLDINATKIPLYCTQSSKTPYSTNWFKCIHGLSKQVVYFTLCLVVSSADYLCKQFGPRSGTTKRRARTGSKPLDTLVVFLIFFLMLILKKTTQHTTNNMNNYSACKETTINTIRAHIRHLSHNNQ